MVSLDGLLAKDSSVLSLSGELSGSEGLLPGSMLNNAFLGDNSDLIALVRTLKTTASGSAGIPSELGSLSTLNIQEEDSRNSNQSQSQSLTSIPFSNPRSEGALVGRGTSTDLLTGQAANASFRSLSGDSLTSGDSGSNTAQVLAVATSTTSDYLSDLAWTSATNGWGPVEKDKSNGEQGAEDGRTITLSGKTYNKGLGVHSASELRYTLDGSYTTFRSDIGIDDEVGSNGSASFQVLADGVKLYDSAVMTGNTATKAVNINVTGKQELKLVVTNGGDSTDFDHANWANARLIKNGTPPSGTGIGLRGEYYGNQDLTNLKLSRTDGTVDFDWRTGSPAASIGADTFSARWTGKVQPKYSETYTFYTTSDDGTRLWVNGQQLINNWSNHPATENRGTVTLAAGQKYDIKLEYYENSGRAVEKLAWSSPSQAKQIIPQSQLYAGTTSTRPPTPVPTGQGEQAKSANSFINSIGVAVHLRYTSGPYGNYSGLIKPRLQELGVRHIRDGGAGTDFFQKLNDLATLGIKSTLVMDPRDGNQPQDAVTIAKTIPNSIEAFEGPNEWDINPNVTYKGRPFPDGLRDYQNDLYEAINSDPATADISVLTPSLAGPGNAGQLRPLTAFDKGNIHSYNGAHKPGWGFSEYVIPEVRELTGDKPLVVTETGWSNAAVSQELEAKYVPRLYLEHFNRGIERTFLYELAKESPDNSYESEWGLLNYDGSPQPAFNALRNMIDLLEDPGANFTPDKLDYELSGDMAGVNHTLLQKQNGKFYLSLWQDDEGNTYNPDQNVTLTLNQPLSSAKAYLPLNSTNVVNNYSNPTSINLRVPDHPLVVELS